MRQNYLTENQITNLLKVCTKTRHPLRNQLIVTLLFKHGLRASELTALQLQDLSLDTSHIYIHRLKGSLSTTHPLFPETLRLLKRFLKERQTDSPYLFTNERNEPMTRAAVYYLITSLGKRLGIHIHPHMLRHSTGYALANKGHDTRLIQDYLGHRQIQSTVRYTQTNPLRFNKIWR